VSDLPIACTLPPGELRERAASIDALLRDALVGRAAIAGGLRLRFAGDAESEQRVRELAAAEARCCGFLEFEIARDEHEVVLDVTGAPDGLPAIEAMFAGAAA